MQATLITLVSVLGAGLFGVIAMIYYGFRADLSDLKADNAALRAEFKADISDLRDDNAALRGELAKLVEAVHDLGNKMAAGFADFEVQLTNKMADLEVRLTNKMADFEVQLTEKLVTGLADFEVRLSDKIAVEISGVRQSTAG